MREKTVLGIYPVIPVKHMGESLCYYVDRLGFSQVFDDGDGQEDGISYAGVSRDGLTLHLQTMAPGQPDAMPMIRVNVSNLEELYREYSEQGVVAQSGDLRSTPWGTREFGLYDPNGAAIVYFEDL